MHEMSLSVSLVDMVAARAAAEGAARVIRVGVEVGALGHVEPGALAFCLESAAQGTALEGARFEIATPPGRARCFACGREVEIASRLDDCPRCGGTLLSLLGGEELRVTEMEIV